MASSTASGDLAAALQGLAFIERGWLSSNNVLLHGAPGEGATLVDTGYCTHAEQTLALVRHALGAESLARIVNTHLHSDHCGGNALLQRELGAPLLIPPGQWDAVVAWDEDALSYRPTRQRCVRFRPDARIAPGEVLRVGARSWACHRARGYSRPCCTRETACGQIRRCRQRTRPACLYHDPSHVNAA